MLTEVKEKIKENKIIIPKIFLDKYSISDGDEVLFKDNDLGFLQLNFIKSLSLEEYKQFNENFDKISSYFIIEDYSLTYIFFKNHPDLFKVLNEFKPIFKEFYKNFYYSIEICLDPKLENKDYMIIHIVLDSVNEDVSLAIEKIGEIKTKINKIKIKYGVEDILFVQAIGKNHFAWY